MAETTLLLRPNDLNKLTNISGNVDIDKLTPFIYIAQSTKLKRILTLPLYDKILEDFENDDLSGDYLLIYEEFIVDILVYFSAYFYWSFGSYQLDNSGAYRKTIDNGEPLEAEELIRVAKMYEQLAQSIVLVYEDFLKDKEIPELQPNNSCNKSSNSRGLNWYLNGKK